MALVVSSERLAAPVARDSHRRAGAWGAHDGRILVASTMISLRDNGIMDRAEVTVTGEQQVLAGALMKSGAAEILRGEKWRVTG